MKKRLVIYICIIGLILFLVIPKEKEEIRVRVIANSNNAYDQEIKYVVASLLVNILGEYQDKSNLKGVINEDLEKIESKILSILDEKNYPNVSLDISFGKEKFPTKTYNDKVIPGGVYETLVIRIGKANGSNWWSLLYPEFFSCSYEEINSGDVEYRSYFWELIQNIKN